MVLIVGEGLLGIGCISNIGFYVMTLITLFPRVDNTVCMAIPGIIGVVSGIVLHDLLLLYYDELMVSIGIGYLAVSVMVCCKLPNDKDKIMQF